MSKTYFIIGSNSFSGSNFIDFILKKKIKVIGISRSKEIDKKYLKYKSNKNKSLFKFYQLDLNKDLNKIIKLINYFKPSFIVNYAAQGMVEQSWEKPEDWYYTNLYSQVKFYNLLNYKNFIKKIIHVSTPEVYGSTHKKILENTNFNPNTPYAISRAAMDLHLLRYYKYKKLPIIITRTANVYGPGQQIYRVIPKSFVYFRKNKKFPLDGSGNSKRSFIYIDDVSSATYKISIKGKIGQTYHISTNRLIKIKNLIQINCKITNRKFKKSIKIKNDRVGKDMVYNLNSNKLRNKIKWIPKINIKSGLLKTLNWVDEHLETFKLHELSYSHKK